MLAVTLGHLESVRTLLNKEANVNCENGGGWTGNWFILHPNQINYYNWVYFY